MGAGWTAYSGWGALACIRIDPSPECFSRSESIRFHACSSSGTSPRPSHSGGVSYCNTRPMEERQAFQLSWLGGVWAGAGQTFDKGSLQTRILHVHLATSVPARVSGQGVNPRARRGPHMASAARGSERCRPTEYRIRVDPQCTRNRILADLNTMVLRRSQESITRIDSDRLG